MSWASATRRAVKAAEILKPKATAPFAFKPAVVDWDRLVSLDFETKYDTAYTLSKLSTSEYVRDARFEALMVGIKIGKGKTRVIPGPKIKAELAKINWATHSLLCHNIQFDGFILSHHYGVVPAKYYCTLSMARGLHSNEIGAGLDEVSIHYGGQGKIEGGVEGMKGLGFKELFANKPLWNKSSQYCANDVDEMYRIFKEMHAVYPPNELELIHMTARMFCAPVLRVDIPRVQAEYEREVVERKELMLGTINPRDYDNKETLKTKAERELQGEERDMLIVKRVIGSNEKFAALLMEAGLQEHQLPTKISPAWMKRSPSEKEITLHEKYTYAFAKDDLEFTGLPDQVWSLFPELDPNDPGDVIKASARQIRLQQLVDVRISVKSTTNITRAERFLEAGKNGMPLPVGYSYYRAHCLTGDAQVLTRSGWIALADWQGGEIAQWSPDGSIRFASATANQFEVRESLVQADSRYHSCTYTKGHTLPTLTSYGTFKPRKAGEAMTTRFGIPITGVLDGDENISPLQAQIAVMVQADGNVRSDVSRGLTVRFGFTKSRKIERCKELLCAAGIPFMETLEDKVVRIRVGAADYHKMTELVGDNKQFSPRLLNAPIGVKQTFISELSHWDGDVEPQPRGFTYSTTSGYNAQFVATMAHLTGRAAFVSKRDRNQEGWSTSYRVYIRSDKKTRSDPKHYEEVPFEGVVYCPTTETGYFMVRQRGNIVVTGNTGRWGGNNKMNMQNLTRGGELRLSIMAAPGHQMAVADSGQIEARVNAWLWDQADLLEAFRDARDIYSEFATKINGRTITKADKIERHIGKTCVLGLGYQMGAPKLQMTLAKGALGGPKIALPLEEVHRIVNLYRRENYKIAQGWQTCAGWIEHMADERAEPITYKCLEIGYEYIRLPNGMCLKYPNLKKAKGEKGWDEWSYQSGDMRKKIYGGLLCENLVQALARIIVAEQMLMIDKKYPIVMTTHDEAVAHPKTKDAAKCYDFMEKCMTTPMWWCPDIPLAAEGGFDVRYSK